MTLAGHTENVPPPGQPSGYAELPTAGFHDASEEWRRLFGESLGTFFLVLIATGGAMVNARFGARSSP